VGLKVVVESDQDRYLFYRYRHSLEIDWGGKRRTTETVRQSYHFQKLSKYYMYHIQSYDFVQSIGNDMGEQGKNENSEKAKNTQNKMPQTKCKNPSKV